MKAQNIDIPMYIGGKEVFTDDKREIRPPHELKTQIGTFNFGTKAHVKQAIDAALAVRNKINNLPESENLKGFMPKVSIGIKSGEMISGNIGSSTLKRLDYTVIGDVVNTAQRLQSKAEAGQIVLMDLRAMTVSCGV